MESIKHEREMAVTHADFFRLLPKVVAEERIQRQPAAALVTTDIGAIKITLAPESTRQIALLKIPLTRVTMEFQGYTTAQYEEFMRRFNLSFQKGGG